MTPQRDDAVTRESATPEISTSAVSTRNAAAAVELLRAIEALHPVDRDNIREQIAADVLAAEEHPLQCFELYELLDEVSLRFNTGAAIVIKEFFGKLCAEKEAARDANPGPQ